MTKKSTVSNKKETKRVSNKKETKRVFKHKAGGRGVKGPYTEEQKAERPWLWKKGESGNPNGRTPGSFDPVKEAGRRIAETRLPIPAKTRRQIEALGFTVEDDYQMTILEKLLLDAAMSNNPGLVDMYMDRTFGKVPNKNINTNQSIDLVARFKNKLTDAELEAINNGQDALDILLSKLPDINE